MKKIILLLLVLGALIGIAFVARDTGENRLKPIQSRAKLLTDLDVNAVKKIRIKEGSKSATAALTGDIWTVAERSNYPAAFEKISNLLLELKDQKAGNQTKLGKGAWGDVQLKAPGDGKDEETGLQVELLGEGDKALATLILGKNQSSTKVGKEENPMMGGGGSTRYARVVGDPETSVWVLGNQFSDISTRAEDWIEKSFIDVQKLKEVEVTAANAADSWKASRKDESVTDFTLADAKPGEEIDNAKASLAALLSSASFTDILPKDKATPDFMKDAVKAKLSTFDGFTYNVAVLKKGTGSDEKHYATVTVSADIPKERPAVKDEKEEDKKKADEAFKTQKTASEEKLAKEKKVEGWVYEISSYTVTALLKKRSEMMKDKPKDGAPAAPTAPGLGSIPGLPPAPEAAAPKINATVTPAPQPKPAPITVTTPPVSVPATATPAPTPPKPDELKPKPSGPTLPGDGKPATPKPEAPKADAPKPPAAPAPAATEPAKAK